MQTIPMATEPPETNRESSTERTPQEGTPTTDAPSAPARPNPRQKRKRERKIASPYAPSVWPTWLVIGFAWVVARLPLSWLFTVGRWVGNLLFRLAHDRRHVTMVNLRLCFPEQSETERLDMARRVFQQLGIGALELMMPWLNPKRDLSDRFTIEGQAHLDAALAEGRGVILIGAHYAVMDTIAKPLSECGPIDVMYRFNKNPAWEWLQVQGRKHYFDGVIEREDIRQTLRRLKRGRAIWYAADQDYGPNHSVFAPFFGVQAATIVATSRFARLNNSPVLLLTQTRDVEAMRWTIKFSPVIEGFPSGDDVQDATLMNGLIEAEVRQYPDQYLWVHKRFKTRPEGEGSPYKL